MAKAKALKASRMEVIIAYLAIRNIQLDGARNAADPCVQVACHAG